MHLLKIQGSSLCKSCCSIVWRCLCFCTASLNELSSTSSGLPKIHSTTGHGSKAQYPGEHPKNLRTDYSRNITISQKVTKVWNHNPVNDIDLKLLALLDHKVHNINQTSEHHIPKDASRKKQASSSRSCATGCLV